jgi:predicted DNA-binding protein YlxM (UPF0122 family)
MKVNLTQKEFIEFALKKKKEAEESGKNRGLISDIARDLKISRQAAHDRIKICEKKYSIQLTIKRNKIDLNKLIII